MASGAEYIIEFDAKSSVARKISVNAENASYQPSFSQTIDVSPEGAHYKYEFR
ncbi:hypothetical protein D3C85_1857820 [compost metagenome]